MSWHRNWSCTNYIFGHQVALLALVRVRIRTWWKPRLYCFWLLGGILKRCKTPQRLLLLQSIAGSRKFPSDFKPFVILCQWPAMPTMPDAPLLDTLMPVMCDADAKMMPDADGCWWSWCQLGWQGEGRRPDIMPGFQLKTLEWGREVLSRREREFPFPVIPGNTSLKFSFLWRFKFSVPGSQNAFPAHPCSTHHHFRKLPVNG